MLMAHFPAHFVSRTERWEWKIQNANVVFSSDLELEAAAATTAAPPPPSEAAVASAAAAAAAALGDPGDG